MPEHVQRMLRLDRLAFGGDYNPDQWDESVWVEDVRLMQEAGVNLVTLPVFSWPLLEPSPGEFDFGWLERVVDLLWSAGIHLDLATATATPPAWLIRQHPDVLPSTADGVRLEFGSRQAYCPSSPVLREHALRLTRAMADRFGDHPALRMWHVSNEYGDHVARCWCPTSAEHFRRWLTERYTTLAALNEAWGTSCWGQHYGAWTQIEPPRTATGPINPAQRLDFERFSSDAFLELFRAEVEILHERTPAIPVTTNFMSLFRELDYWDFADAEDIVTDDAYPDPADPRAHVASALNYGLMRSLKRDRPWLLLEQAPSAVSWREVNVPKAPGRMRLDSMQALAHGSDGVMSFQWRQAAFGPERFHSALLGHRGVASRSFQESKALGAELVRLAPVRGSRVLSRVALIADWESWWCLSAPDSLPSTRLDWLGQMRAWHSALAGLGVVVDLVRREGPFEGYDAVLAPNLYVSDATVDDALTSFVTQGGRLVVGPFSSVSDPQEKVHPGGAPGPLRELLGVEIDEWWPLPEGAVTHVDMGSRIGEARTWTEWVVPRAETEIVGRYQDGALAGRAAILRRPSGDGAAWYLSCDLGEDALTHLLRSVLAEADIPVWDVATHEVEIVTRTDGTDDFTFVLNHADADAVVGVPRGAQDLLTGESATEFALEPAGVVVLRRPSARRTDPILPIGRT